MIIGFNILNIKILATKSYFTLHNYPSYSLCFCHSYFILLYTTFLLGSQERQVIKQDRILSLSLCLILTLRMKFSNSKFLRSMFSDTILLYIWVGLHQYFTTNLLSQWVLLEIKLQANNQFLIGQFEKFACLSNKLKRPAQNVLENAIDSLKNCGEYWPFFNQYLEYL